MDKDIFQKQESELRDILNEWDVLGVIGAQDDGGPFDEYDDLNHWILSALHKGTDDEEVKAMLKKSLREHYGLPLEPTGLELTLQKIFVWWQKYKYYGYNKRSKIWIECCT